MTTTTSSTALATIQQGLTPGPGHHCGRTAAVGLSRRHDTTTAASALFSAAVLVAHRMTDEGSKASALLEVGEALAVTDPARACRIAESGPDATWRGWD
jgi:hypothetical protein